MNNRRNATYWNSTRDTALCVEAFADFLRRSGEDRPEMTVEVYYDGKLQKAVEITPKNLFTFDNMFVLEGDAVAAGRHTIELKRKGSGPVYYNGYLTTFTLEDFIKHAGLEVKVDRKYYRLVKVDKSVHASGSRGQAVNQKVEKYERQELPNLSVVKSGDLVEIELEIQSKNDYEYLIFEDMKPAGFRAGGSSQRLHGQRPWGLRRVPRQPRGLLRQPACPRPPQCLLSDAGGNPRQVQCPANPRLRHVRAGVERQFG